MNDNPNPYESARFSAGHPPVAIRRRIAVACSTLAITCHAVALLAFIVALRVPLASAHGDELLEMKRLLGFFLRTSACALLLAPIPATLSVFIARTRLGWIILAVAFGLPVLIVLFLVISKSLGAV